MVRERHEADFELVGNRVGEIVDELLRRLAHGDI
jgi:hypothetical protein